MPATSTREINRRLIKERDEGGAIALGRVLTLIIDADGQDAEEAIEAANDASREDPADPAQHPVGRMAQRRITDTTRCSNPNASLRRLADVHAEGNTDLAWTRATLWRGLIAASLDQAPYEQVQRAVVSGESTHPSVELMAAWLAQSLRCPVEVNRIPDALAITQVRLDRASGPIILERPDGKTAALIQPDQPEHRIAMPIRQLPECLAEELRRLDDDEVYGEVLTKGLARLTA